MRRVSLPRYREAECKDPRWAVLLARHPAYKDLLAWVAHQRDLRVDRLLNSKEDDLHEIRGEIRALNDVYKSLASNIEE
jgi:hypothetical protein